jgi:hypothetical protein
MKRRDNGLWEWLIGGVCVFIGVTVLFTGEAVGPVWVMVGAVWFSISEIKGRRK